MSKTKIRFSIYTRNPHKQVSAHGRKSGFSKLRAGTATADRNAFCACPTDIFLKKRFFIPLIRCFLDYLFVFVSITNPKFFTDMKELVEKINAEFAAFTANAAAQVEKGNKAAGTRARKSALELSKLMKEFRKVSVEASK